MLWYQMFEAQQNGVELRATNKAIVARWHPCAQVALCKSKPIINYTLTYMEVVLNQSSQEPPFRKSFASFRGPIRVAFPKSRIRIRNQIYEIKQTRTNYTINWLLFARMNGNDQNVIVICCFFSLGPTSGMAKCIPFGQDMARVDTSFAHLSRAFREPFARNRKKKWVDTISYLVFRGSSANLSPTCTFLERYLSRRHFKSMPVDLDHIKPFMGFCTTLIYIYIYVCKP